MLFTTIMSFSVAQLMVHLEECQILAICEFLFKNSFCNLIKYLLQINTVPVHNFKWSFFSLTATFVFVHDLLEFFNFSLIRMFRQPSKDY
jgi:hypothetical protein